MKLSKKAQAGMVGLVVTLVIGVILLVGVLVPITNNAVTNVNMSIPNSTGGTTLQYGFTGTNKTIADNLVTFILIGVLVLVAGLAIYGMSRR